MLEIILFYIGWCLGTFYYFYPSLSLALPDKYHTFLANNATAIATIIINTYTYTFAIMIEKLQLAYDSFYRKTRTLLMIICRLFVNRLGVVATRNCIYTVFIPKEVQKLYN
jgi:hypothetical protein